ncbi:MAG: N-6 DNA methylase, partial [Prevotella sp.]|nr:N-6 DNA methylase [Prevotella sp.]
MAFNKRQRLSENIEAIRTAFVLDRERRVATEAERALMRKYCGFGGLKCILNPVRELADAVYWPKSDLNLFAPVAELHRVLRTNSRDEREYKQYVDSLKSSVLTAFYTPAEITSALADVLGKYIQNPSYVLEPSAGAGAFVDAVLRNNRYADVMAFEKDMITGKILGHLHPEAKVRVEGFERIERPLLNHFDLALSNIPFGDIAVFDAEYTSSKEYGRRSATKAIHKYFFLKGLDAVRDGGVVAFITSRGVSDAPANAEMRVEMLRHANLVSAVRLPDNMFSDNAGTDVGSDLIILQKDTGKKVLSGEETLFTQTAEQEGTSNLFVNRYFLNHPEHIIHTDVRQGTDAYGKPAMIYGHNDGIPGIAGDLRRIADGDMRLHFSVSLYSGKKEQAQTNGAEPEINVPAVEKPMAETSGQTVSTSISLNRTGEQVQLSLFDLWDSMDEDEDDDDEEEEEREEEEVDEQEGQEEQDVDNTEEPEDPDYKYKILNWEDNLPINGFAELMMNLTPAQRAALRNIAEKHKDEQPGGTEREKHSEATADNKPDGQEKAKKETGKANEQPIEQPIDLTPRTYDLSVQAHHREGSIVIDKDGTPGVLRDITAYGAVFVPVNLPGNKREQLLHYVALRDAYERLYRYEANRHEADDKGRETLNARYDEFVSRYGCLNTKQNVKTILMDVSGRDILSLERAEDGKFVKADIFFRPVSFSVEEQVYAGTPEEALSASLNKYGYVDLDYMRKLTDSTIEELLSALQGRIFFNPLADGYEIKDKFVAGNVIEKAERIEDWIKEHEEDEHLSDVRRSLDALKASFPQRITFEELDFNFGERWIPTGVYSSYMSRLYDTDVRIAYMPGTDEYHVACGFRTMKITDEFMVKGYYRHYDGMSLLKHALHNTCPDMMKSIGTDENGNDIKIRDSEGIQLAN